jgi:xylulokinase
VDTDGEVFGQAFREYSVLTPRQGWAEQWPNIWVDAVYQTIKQVVEESKVDNSDISGISVSSLYGGSGIPVDNNWDPVRPCIIWADRRATYECEWVTKKVGEERLFEVTGNVIDPYYGYTKMLWIKNNEPTNWLKIHRFETPNAYVIRLLTGEENIDHCSAGNYGGIYDLQMRGWSEELMEELGIDRGFFPEKFHASDEIVGEVTCDGSKKTGLSIGTPVVAGGIDAAVSTLAGAAYKEGDLALMLGTSMCNGFISEGSKLSSKMINYPNVVNCSEYVYSFTGITTAGYSVRWFRDELGQKEVEESKKLGVSAYKLLDRLAEKAPVGSDNLLFLPHLMVGERAPYWNNDLRGGFLGLTVNHTRSHMFRAILEGVAYALRYCIDASRETGLKVKRATLVDGGSRSPLWRQIIADVTGVSMSYIPDSKEAPIGDAILAGIATGELSSHMVIDEWVKEKIPMTPIPENQRLYEKYYQLYLSSLESLDPIFKMF